MKEYIFARPDEAADTAKRDAFCRGELIRCKDCKHFDKDEFCDIWEVYRTNESYCDIAERKEE